MDLIGLKRAIEELQNIVDKWDENHTPASIEVDMSLERVKSIYEMIRFPSAPVPQPEVEVEVEPEVEAEVEVVAEPEPEIETVEIVEPVAEVEAEVEVEPEVDDEKEKERKREIRRKIMSLYEGVEYVDETEGVEEKIEIKEESVEVKEEIKIAPTPTHSLSSQIGINDRLLLTNELFAGDMATLDNFLAAIEQQQSFDDALLYIAERYSWRGDGDGAKLLYTLLENNYK